MTGLPFRELPREPFSLTVPDAADHTGLSEWQIRELAKSGRIEVRYTTSVKRVVIWESLKSYILSRPTDPERVS